MSLILVGPYTTLSAPVQRGLSTPFCQRQTGRWSPTNGWTFDQDFRGLSQVAMQNLASQYGNAGIEYEITIQAGIATMRTVDTTGNVTIDVWEIGANQQMVSWLENPLLLAHLQNIASDFTGSSDQDILDATVASFISVLANGIANNTPATQTASNVVFPPGSLVVEGVFAPTKFFGTKTPFDWSTVSADDYLPIMRLYKYALAGRDTFFSDYYVLRHSTNASNRGYFNVADTNVNCIYTQSQFYSEITNSGYWVFPAPNEIIGALNAIFVGIGTALPNFLKGAIKGGSSRVTTANNRVNITTEYKLFTWSTDAYSLAT